MLAVAPGMRSNTWRAVTSTVRGVPSGFGSLIRKPVPMIWLPFGNFCST